MIINTDGTVGFDFDSYFHRDSVHFDIVYSVDSAIRVYLLVFSTNFARNQTVGRPLSVPCLRFLQSGLILRDRI
jgi:hypothetical protein